MKRIATMAALFTALLTVPAAANDLVPAGTLRATYIGTNPVQAFIDPASKQIVGPAAEITRALAQKLGVVARGEEERRRKVRRAPHARQQLRGQRHGVAVVGQSQCAAPVR